MFRLWICLILSLIALPSRADDWPQWLGPQRDGVWRETGIVQKFPADGPKVMWRTPIGAGYAGPAVASGRVYITDRVLNAGAQNDPNREIPFYGFYLIKDGAVRLNDAVVTDLDLPRKRVENALVQAGKRRFVRLTPP